jgi:hypothetical protein
MKETLPRLAITMPYPLLWLVLLELCALTAR